MTWAMTTFRRKTLYKQPDLLPLDQAVYSAGRKPGFFISRALQLKPACGLVIGPSLYLTGL